MTDERDPGTERPSLEADVTSRVPTPTPATTSTLPLTPTAVVTSGPSRRRSRRRWAIGVVFIALVTLTSVAVALFLTGGSSTATVLGYVPADTVVYGEVRLDLPGDQRRAVGAFLSKFPGFADQAALDTKLDEVLDQLVKDATKNEQSYTTNIKPWFDGELAFSVGTLPPAASISGADPAVPPAFRGLALVSIKDPALAQAWFDAAIAKAGTKSATETYNGTTLTVFEKKTGGITAALAVIDGKVAVAGDIVSVKAAVDSKGASTFAAAAGPKAAIDSATGDHIGFVYVALRPLIDWSTEMSKAVSPPGGTLTPAMSAAMLKVIPDWGAYWLRIERDAVVMEAVAPKPETILGPIGNRSSAVVEHIPESAVVAVMSNDYGKTLKQFLDLYRSDPTLKPMLDQLDSALGLVGGEDAALGWVGDTAVVVNVADGTPEGGLIAVPTDKAAADHLFTALRSFIALAGAQQGLSVSDETYHGATITTVDLGDLTNFTGTTGASGLPMPAGHLQISYAVTDGVVVIGSGPGFVKHVLDTTTATSLQSNERYKKLADRAGAGTGTTYVDITTIRGLVEKAAADATALTGPDALAEYDKQIKPFLAPFDAIAASSSVNGDLTRSVIYITLN